MLEAILAVLARSPSVQEEESNDWYTNIHLHDVMRFRGPIAAQRFKVNEQQIVTEPFGQQWQYLALYEVSDATRFTQGHIEALGTVRMQVAQAFDYKAVTDHYYCLSHLVDNAPASAPEGHIMQADLNLLQCVGGPDVERD